MKWSYTDSPVKYFFLIIFAAILFSFSSLVFAHEQWFLTSEQMQKLLAQPRPLLFSEFNQTNISILILVFLTLYILIAFSSQAAREFFPDHQAQLASKRRFVPLILRITTSSMLFMAVFGLNPRFGVDLFSSSTFIFPDLELYLLPSFWPSLKWLELGIAISLLLGIYVRLMAAILLLMSVFGLFLFKIHLFCYIGFLTGVTLYLIIEGPGMWYFSLPTFYQFRKDNIDSHNRAQFILRFLSGLDFACTGFITKFIYPNLAIGLLTMQNMPTFGLDVETVVFWMAIIETFAGLLLMLGVLTRPISFILLGCFVFMAYAVNEPLYSHVIFYGVLLACYINGAGQWRSVIAKDKPAHIVILGANLSGIYCAIALENLLGKNSNVKVTLVHHENYFQFGPFLSDVISGLVQPANIVNSIRYVCPTHHFIQGRVKKIHTEEQRVEISTLSDQIYVLDYDQLIVAHETLDYLAISGLNKNAMPIANISDALFIRKHILDCLEKAELSSIASDRQSLLTFLVIGGGLRGASVVTEIRSLIKTALIYFSTISFEDVKIVLFDHHPEILSTFDQQFSTIVHRNLEKLGIQVRTNVNIDVIKTGAILLSSNENIFSQTIVNALSSFTHLIQVDDQLKVSGKQNIFAVSLSSYVSNHIPFQAFYEKQLGEFVAYNAWANSQNKVLRRWKQRDQFFYVACLGQHASMVAIGRIVLTGRLAWIISRLVCLKTLPGMEKTLRVMVDWFFNFLFRQNISSFSPVRSQQAQYQPFSVYENE